MRGTTRKKTSTGQVLVFGWEKAPTFNFQKVGLNLSWGNFFISNHLYLRQQIFKIQICKQQNVV